MSYDNREIHVNYRVIGVVDDPERHVMHEELEVRLSELIEAMVNLEQFREIDAYMVAL